MPAGVYDGEGITAAAVKPSVAVGANTQAARTALSQALLVAKHETTPTNEEQDVETNHENPANQECSGVGCPWNLKGL